MNRNQTTPRISAKLLLVALSAIVTTSEAALLALADAPLYLITAVQPNILLTFDDSGSMTSGYIPDTISGTAYSGTALGCASNINGVYYNPLHKYDPPLDANRQPLNNAAQTNFNSAYLNGYFPTRAYTAPSGPNTNAINLATNYRPTWDADFANNAITYRDCGQGGAQAAYYFVYDASITTGGCPPANTTKASCYRRVVVSATSGTGPAGADERQNFANWFSYYRTRNMMAKGGIATAYSRLSDYVRVAAQHLYLNAAADSTGSSNLIFPGNFAANALQPFSGAFRTDFYTRLFDSPANSNTPLREAMVRAGNYLTTIDPYLDTPGAGVSPSNQERACRQNFHVMVTDGYWNGPNGPFAATTVPAAATVGDADRTVYTLPTPDPSVAVSAPLSQFNGTVVNYPAGGKRPYSGTNASTATSNTPTLADVAFYYWSHDLRTGGATATTDGRNIVPPRLVNNTAADANTQFWDPKNDPASWQHMVNFTIGLGIPGTLTASDATLASITAGTTNWPSPSNNNTAGNNIDDLWHAAVNSRGMYFSANNPVDLSNAFVAVVNEINDRISAASSVAMNSGTLTTNSYVFQSRFNSGDWSGQLLAYAINPTTGALAPTYSWDAGTVLSSLQNYNDRHILSYNPTSRRGIRFRWPSNPATPTSSELSTAQISDLNFNSASATSDGKGEARLNWLRGDASNETATSLNFRQRQRLCGATTCPPGTNNGWLGDTIDSTPVYVGAPPFGYPDSLESQPYSSYKNGKSGRTPVIYVGANDGMLHAFNANSGFELFAYVPSIFYPRLTDLTNSTYGHGYFVNGNHTVIDAFVNGSWRTVLAGSLRKGGRGIYALDVSDPSQVTEGNANASVLWEFSNSNDPDMGYSFAEPVITRLHNGKWAVIVGNGYNSTASGGAATGHAVAYVLYIENGIGNTWTAGDFVKLDTMTGTLATPNGLSSTSVVDVDGDYIADYIYAGDIQGNLWRWDIRDSNSANWAGTVTKVFAAGSTKPITDRPVVGKHPDGLSGVMVYFGTGKYIETTDASVAGATTQTFYGIWDNNVATPVPSANLLTQTVTGTASDSGGTFRLLSDNPIDWSKHMGWRLDLPTHGERVVADPVLRNGVIIFTTVIPSSDPCTFGGSGWLMELNPTNGGTPISSTFDTNGDGKIDGNDVVGVPGSKKPPGGMQSNNIPAMPGIMQSDPNVAGGKACGGCDCKFINKSDGTVQRVSNCPTLCNDCRTSWRQRR